MQVDQQQSFSYSPTPAFEDFFNIDLLSGGSSSFTSSKSRSSSPRSASFPLTPPQSSFAPSFAGPHSESITDPTSFFNFLEDEINKQELSSAATASSTPYDFLGAFNALASSSSSGSSPESLTGSTASPAPMFAIDPQLVGTPATSKAMSDFDEDEENDHDHSDEEDDRAAVAPVKVAGKGKNRKGTVQSGGVVKKSSTAPKDKESIAKKEETSLSAKIDAAADDWRPSPEEYKKMSSKEKRQLRNKISARNFRVRRKEYISTLEGDIAERDRILDAIRTELGSTQSENVALRQEIAALKKALLDGRVPALPPPAPLPAISAAEAITSTPISATSTSSPLLKPNTQKDLPSSPRLGARAFWGGFGGMGNGITPVHTTLVPDLGVASLGLLSGKHHQTRRILQENINPSLNEMKSANENTNINVNTNANVSVTGFDSFTEMNPFTLKTLDAYRMQLWGKMAAQHHHHQQNPQQPHQPLTGLAGGLKPHYFSSAPSPVLSTLLSGKAPLSSSSAANAHNYHSTHTPPSPPHSHSHPSSTPPAPSKEQAMYAALASQTLFQRLGSAFWEAFSGSSSSSSAPRNWDAEKVRRVLEGKAVVRVVDVEEDVVPVRSRSAASTPRVPERRCSVTGVLEESMRSLTIAKK